MTAAIGEERVLAGVHAPGTLTKVLVDLQFDLGVRASFADPNGTRTIYILWERGQPDERFDIREDAADALYRRQAARVAEWAASDAVLKIAGTTFWNARGTWQERARAAISALLGEPVGGES